MMGSSGCPVKTNWFSTDFPVWNIMQRAGQEYMQNYWKTLGKQQCSSKSSHHSSHWLDFKKHFFQVCLVFIFDSIWHTLCKINDFYYSTSVFISHSSTLARTHPCTNPDTDIHTHTQQFKKKNSSRRLNVFTPAAQPLSWESGWGPLAPCQVPPRARQSAPPLPLSPAPGPGCGAPMHDGGGAEMGLA